MLAISRAGPQRRFARALARLFLCAATALACAEAPSEGPGRVLLIGIDGATLKLAGPMMDEGRLPNLAALARRGVVGPLRSLVPMYSPRIWNTIATGKQPQKHGITGFATKDRDGVPRLMLSTDRRSHALWNIASEAGLSVGVVNFWNTFPLDRINGVMVSDHLIERQIEGRIKLAKARVAPRGPVIWPEAWQERVTRILKDSEPLTAIENPLADLDSLPAWLRGAGTDLAHFYSEDESMARIALEIEDRLQPDLMLVLLVGIDRASHFLWGTVEPNQQLYPERLRAPDAERRAGAEVLRRYYEYTDALIGRLMEGYGARDLIMVVSDHGFEAGVGMGLLTGRHKTEEAIEGVLFAAGPGISAGQPPGDVSVEDITPTILVWLGLPVGADMDGRSAGFLKPARPAPAPIASYDTRPIQRVSGESSGVEEAIIERLRQLGYLE